MSDTPSDMLELYDGVNLSTTVFASKRADVTFFVNGGGVAYLTSHGHRRMALVPVAVGEEYERSKARGAEAETRGVKDE